MKVGAGQAQHVGNANPHHSQKTLEIAVETLVFSVSPRVRKIGPAMSSIFLKPYGPQAAPKWAQAGNKLHHLEPVRPKLEPSGASLAAIWGRNGPFGRCWADLQNAQITTVLPAEAVPV